MYAFRTTHPELALVLPIDLYSHFGHDFGNPVPKEVNRYAVGTRDDRATTTTIGEVVGLSPRQWLGPLIEHCRPGRLNDLNAELIALSHIRASGD
tara:strand:+ start:155 stop:439 length:285 start_codon:yes stop_codon:yes gene_type:complete